MAGRGRPEWVERALEPGGLLLAAILLLALAAFVQPQFDPDFWWHLRDGLHILAAGLPPHNAFTFTANHRPYIIQEWGSEVIYALLYRSAGMTPILLLMAVVTWVGFALALRRAHRPGGSLGVLAVGGALVVLAGLEIWGPRSEMFTFGFSGVLLFLLDHHRRHGGRGILAVVPLFWVWGNLHGGFTIGLGLFLVVLGGDAIGNWLHQRSGSGGVQGARGAIGLLAPVPWGRWRQLAGLWPVCAAVVMVNPIGVGVYKYPLKLLASHVAQASIQEWQSPDFHLHGLLPALVLVVTALLVAPQARRTSLTDLLLAGAGLVLALYAVRNLVIFGIVVLPLWVDGAGAWWALLGPARLPAPVAPGRRPVGLVVAALVVLAVVAGLRIGAMAASPQNRPLSAAYPVAVGRVLCHGPAARVFAPYGASGWLLYRIDRRAPIGRGCAPDRVFIFGEVDLIGPRIFQQYLMAAAGLPAA
ncbi:MAG TPA: hypothetical protein VMW49_01635, partial [Candidatus Dormibacteraeota bacterium]|nr:hypothetical protein [Candidatus Dormibacteraeota bacterium]